MNALFFSLFFYTVLHFKHYVLFSSAFCPLLYFVHLLNKVCPLLQFDRAYRPSFLNIRPSITARPLSVHPILYKSSFILSPLLLQVLFYCKSSFIIIPLYYKSSFIISHLLLQVLFYYKSSFTIRSFTVCLLL